MLDIKLKVQPCSAVFHLPNCHFLVMTYCFADPAMETSYKMEVLRNPRVKTRPLFRVTSDDGEQVGLTCFLTFFRFQFLFVDCIVLLIWLLIENIIIPYKRLVQKLNTMYSSTTFFFLYQLGFTLIFLSVLTFWSLIVDLAKVWPEKWQFCFVVSFPSHDMNCKLELFFEDNVLFSRKKLYWNIISVYHKMAKFFFFLK